MFIEHATGEVGVGTTTPSYRLDVAGDSRTFGSTNAVQYIESRRYNLTYGGSALIFNSPRSDTADLGTQTGRGMIYVPGQNTTTASIMYMSATTSGLTSNALPSALQSYIKVVGSSTSINASTNYIELGAWNSTGVLTAYGTGIVNISTTLLLTPRTGSLPFTPWSFAVNQTGRYSSNATAWALDRT